MILFILRVELDKSENFTIEKPYCTFIGYPNTFYLKKIIKKISAWDLSYSIAPKKHHIFCHGLCNRIRTPRLREPNKMENCLFGCEPI